MIGVFDSGFGGLTILRALARLPEQLDLVYLGDNARAPYGGRSGSEIVELTQKGCETLFERGCRLVIVACNTASAVALRHLQKDWLPAHRQRKPETKINVLGIIVPTIEQVTQIQSGSSHDIAVFATQRTVETDVFPIEIAKRHSGIRVHQQACPWLASAIESGAKDPELSEYIHEQVRALVSRIGRVPQQAILGCTHYPLVSQAFSTALGPTVEIVSQPDAVASSLSLYLKRHPEYEIQNGKGLIQFLTTGFVPHALERAQAFWGDKIQFQQIAT